METYQIIFTAALIVAGGVLFNFTLWSNFNTKSARRKNFFSFAVLGFIGAFVFPHLMLTPEGLNQHGFVLFLSFLGLLVAILALQSIDMEFPYRMVLIFKGSKKFVTERRDWKWRNHYPLDLNSVCFTYEFKDLYLHSVQQVLVYVEFYPSYLWKEYIALNISEMPKRTVISMQKHLPELYFTYREAIRKYLLEPNRELLQGFYNLSPSSPADWKTLEDQPLLTYLNKLELADLLQGEIVIKSITISRIPRAGAGCITLK